MYPLGILPSSTPTGTELRAALESDNIWVLEIPKGSIATLKFSERLNRVFYNRSDCAVKSPYLYSFLFIFPKLPTHFCDFSKTFSIQFISFSKLKVMSQFQELCRIIIDTYLSQESRHPPWRHETFPPTYSFLLRPSLQQLEENFKPQVLKTS